MDRPDRTVRVGNALAQRAQQLPVLLRHGVANRVGDVDGRGAFGDHGLDHATQKIRIRAAAVLGRELDVVGEFARKPHGQLRLLEDLLRAHAQLFLHVQRRSGDEGMDALGGGRRERLGGARDVLVVGARQRTHRRILDHGGDRPNRLEVAVAGGRETRLDDIDLQPLQLLGDAQLFLARHRSARTLFAVAQGGIENDQAVHGCLPKSISLPASDSADTKKLELWGKG
jgi:hypothetical protein